MGSQPIRTQLRKILRENLAGKSCGKFLQENLAGKSCGTGWREKSQFNQDPAEEKLAGKACGKIFWENMKGQGGGEKANLRKALIGGNLAFGIG